MSPSSKWIEGIRPDSSVAEAARLSLDARLMTVAHWLPLAARHAVEDIEYVHRLRVATRRATAALKLYHEWLPSGPRRWFKKRLRKVRRAAGEARDLDVLFERLERELGVEGAPLLALITERRAAAQPDIKRAAERCERKNRYSRKLRLLLIDVDEDDESSGDGKGMQFGSWAKRRMNALAEETFDSLPSDTGDPAALHQFRIRIKALRYAIELLSPAFSPDLREVQYPIVEHIQERLGQINDHSAGASRLQGWSDETKDVLLKEMFDQLVQQEQSRMAEAIGEFRQWWTPERIAQLKVGLAADIT